MPNPPITNYRFVLENTLRSVSASGKTPSLLLHACCAPCSSYVLEYLSSYFNITLFFYNPNIIPQHEYELRLSELQRLVSSMPLQNKVSFLHADYNQNDFLSIADGLENCPERGLRCRKCIALRLSKTADAAASLGSDFFTTTLTISPHKDSALINSCGGQLSQNVGIPYLFSDFKKNNGYKRSIQLSAFYNLYRQNFCGCPFSLQNSCNFDFIPLQGDSSYE